jgi:protein-tyrosine phosphatase
VSLLTSDEISDLELDREELACERAHIEFVSFPIADRSVPASKKSMSEMLAKLSGYLGSGKAILIHCRQGIGRSALLAASLMISGGEDADSVLERISASRGCPVPETAEQKAWIMELAKSVTNLNPKRVATR